MAPHDVWCFVEHLRCLVSVAEKVGGTWDRKKWDFMGVAGIGGGVLPRQEDKREILFMYIPGRHRVVGVGEGGGARIHQHHPPLHARI